MLRNTNFLTVLPNYAVCKSIEFNGLKALPIKLDAPSPNVGIVTSGNRLKSALHLAFETYLKAYTAQELGAPE